MDFDNNGHDMTNFMHKVKKQAKRLFQLSKTRSNNLEINSLSKAQEILAQINGYPDWHALEKTISSKKSLLVKTSEDSKIELKQYTNEHLYLLETEEYIITFLRANSVPTNIDDIQAEFNSFNNMFSFEINMNLHDVSIVMEQNNKVMLNNYEYSLYDISKSFDLTEEQARKLFYIEKSSTSTIKDNDLTAYVVITTNIKNKNNHINLCLSMLNPYNNYKKIHLESMPYINKDRLEKFQLKNGKTNPKLYEAVFIPSGKKNDSLDKTIITKWVYLLNFLVDKKITFSFKYNLTSKNFTFEFQEYEKYKELIDSFINSAIKTYSFNEQELKYISQASFNYVNNIETTGLSLKSQLNNTIFNYNDNSHMRSHHINVIYGKPGSGKSVINSMIALSSILNKNITNIPTMAIVDVGRSYMGIIELLKNIFPVEEKHTIKQFNIENKEDYSINPFDLCLGKREYDREDCYRICQILINLFDYEEEDYKNISSLLFDLIELLNKEHHKLYENNVNIVIDKNLEKLKYQINETTTWWNVVDFLFTQGEDKLAKKAQTYATPILIDLIPLLQSEKIQQLYKNVVTINSPLLQKISKTIIESINKYPFINNPTQLDTSETKIVYFNLDKVCSFREKNIQDYWFGLVLNLSSYGLMGMYNDYVSYSREWKDSWQNYLKTEEISKVYHYYNKLKKQHHYIPNKLIVDEFHRFSDKKTNVDKLTYLARNGRKYNTSISISTQSLKEIESVVYCTTAFFIAEGYSKESQILENYGFENNELNILKKVRFPNWGVKLKTNRGKVFDVVKLEMPPMLKFALSTTSEDVLIRSELIKKFDYFSALEKASKYLENKNIKYHSFKILFEEQIDNNIKQEDIVKNIIQDIK